MKIKTSELTGAALDWAVAKCEGYTLDRAFLTGHHCYPSGLWEPSRDWSQGGPIIENNMITIEYMDRRYYRCRAWVPNTRAYTAWYYNCGIPLYDGDGPTPLIAAMRCYVASKLGDEVEIPDDLT